MMPNGYNPAHYIKDFSWIRDVGNILASTVQKMPELIELNRSVKQNRQHNQELYAATSAWLDNMENKSPKVWSSIAAGMGVSAGELRTRIGQQLRQPKKNESNEDYTNQVIRQVTVPILQAASAEAGGALTVGDVARTTVGLPGGIDIGHQRKLLADARETAQKRKKSELEAAGAVEKREDIALAGEALAKARGVEREGIVPPGTAATREAVAADIGAIRPEALGRPEVRGITGVLPTEIQLAGEERAERRERRVAADVGEEKKPEGRVHARVAAEIKGITGDVRADTIRIDAKRSKIASIQRQLKEDDEQLIKSRKLPAAKRDKMDSDAKTLEAEIAGIQNKVEKGKRRIRDEQEALRIYDETGGKYTIEQIRQALKSGELYAPGGGGPPGITPSPAGPGRQAAPAGPGAGTQVGRFMVKQR